MVRLSPAGSCSGVPAQIHSDYTFTAIVGVFGADGRLGRVARRVPLWLHRLIRHHGRVTRGEPRLVASAGHIGHDGQALLSWIGVAWVVLTLCQLAVTVAGNLAVLPLTGVTFPFVSFGMTSLLVNLAFLALCLNVDLAAAEAAMAERPAPASLLDFAIAASIAVVPVMLGVARARRRRPAGRPGRRRGSGQRRSLRQRAPCRGAEDLRAGGRAARRRRAARTRAQPT